MSARTSNFAFSSRWRQLTCACSVCLVLPSLYGFTDVDAKESIERGANVTEWDSWLGLVPRGAYADSPVATGHIGLPELYARQVDACAPAPLRCDAIRCDAMSYLL